MKFMFIDSSILLSGLHNILLNIIQHIDEGLKDRVVIPSVYFTPIFFLLEE